mgnify:CR=1 FL=1
MRPGPVDNQRIQPSHPKPGTLTEQFPQVLLGVAAVFSEPLDERIGDVIQNIGLPGMSAVIVQGLTDICLSPLDDFLAFPLFASSSFNYSIVDVVCEDPVAAGSLPAGVEPRRIRLVIREFDAPCIRNPDPDIVVIHKNRLARSGNETRCACSASN